MAIEAITITGVTLADSGQQNVDRVTLRLSAQPHPKWREHFWTAALSGVSSHQLPIASGRSRPSIVVDTIELEAAAWQSAEFIREVKSLVAKVNEELAPEMKITAAADQERNEREVALQDLLD